MTSRHMRCVSKKGLLEDLRFLALLTFKWHPQMHCLTSTQVDQKLLRTEIAEVYSPSARRVFEKSKPNRGFVGDLFCRSPVEVEGSVPHTH